MKFSILRKKKTKKDSIDVLSLGLAAGVSVSLYIFIIGIAASFGWGEEIVTLSGEWYLGYAPTVEGSIIGSVWGFVDGFLGGFILGAIYNFFQKLRS